jgi:hypothetical protein
VSKNPTPAELRAEAERLGVLTPAFEQVVRIIEWCDEADATLAAAQSQLRGSR